MYDSMDSLVTRLSSIVASLDAASLTGDSAVSLVEVFSRGEKLMAAGRAVAAQRALETYAWRGRGHQNPAAWIASTTGSSVAAAVGVVQTANALADMPATRDALIAGAVSQAQAAEIVAAVKADPSAEASLLSEASTSTLRQLHNRCENIIASALGDEDLNERVHRSRYLRFRTEAGAVIIDGRLAPSDAAPLIAIVQTRANQLWEQTRRSTHRESLAALTADALCELATGAASGAEAVVNIFVDESAFDRGHTIAGELCEISGVGPIPVSTAHTLATTGTIKRLGRNDHNITRVKHSGKSIPAKLRSAIVARDQACIIPGCDNTLGLEIDHIKPRAEGGATSLDNLARACKYHHYLKTFHGWQIGGQPGAWTWTPPPPNWKQKRRFNRNE